MVVARLRLLTAFVVILLTIVVGGCDSMGVPTPVSPTLAPVATATSFATADVGATNTALTLIPAPTDISNDSPTAVLGPGTFSGTYLFDARPDFIYYLSVTQTD